MTGHAFSNGDRSGLQAGQSNTFTLSLRNHAIVAHAEWEMAMSWSNNRRLPMKDIILMAVYTVSLNNSNTCHHVNSTFAHMPVTHAICSAAPSYHYRCLLLLLLLMKVWMVPLIFGTENSKSIVPGNKLKCGLIGVQHTFLLSFWLSEMSSGPENPAASLHRIDI